MKTILRLFLLSLLVCLPAAATNTVASIQTELLNRTARDSARMVEAYLERNPAAEDQQTAMNLVLGHMQNAKNYMGMLVWLKKRYAFYRTLPEINPDHLINKTIVPIQQLHYQLGQQQMAKDYTAEVTEHWKGTSIAPQIDTLLEKLRKQYAMPDVGEPIAVAFTDMLSGNKIDSKDYIGDLVLVHFWTPACDICKAQKVFIQQGLELYGAQGFSAFGFPQLDDEAALKTFCTENGITWPQCFDAAPENQFVKKLKIVGVPTDLLLDREGNVLAVNPRGDALLKLLSEQFTKE